MELADNEQFQAKGMNPEIERYLAMWERDPKSRVFAPLAESYRKIGQLDRAVEICLKGLQIHPNYVSGRVALGRAYFEKGDYTNAKSQLEMVFEADPENLVAAKTLGEIYEAEGDYQKALLCYRLAHYTTPSAVEITEKIKGIEDILAIRSEVPATPAEKNELRDRELDELSQSLSIARTALRQSEALAAGELAEDEYQETIVKGNIDEAVEKPTGASSVVIDGDDEISLEMEVFFAEAPTPTKGQYTGFQVRQPADAIVADGRARREELTKLTQTELMLRQGYIERAMKVYEEFLLSEPENEQAIRRVRELKDQIEDVLYELRIREGEPERQKQEEEERKEVVYTLVDWLHKVKTVV